MRTTPFCTGRAARRNPAVLLAVAVAAAGLGGIGAATAQPAAGQAGAVAGFEFAAPPSAQANRVYGINRQTGEMNVCQFERPNAAGVGVTFCFAQGISA